MGEQTEDKTASEAAGGHRRARRRHQPSLVRRIFLSLALVSSLAAVVVLLFATNIYQTTVFDDSGRMLEGECGVVKSMLAVTSQTAAANASDGSGDALDAGEATADGRAANVTRLSNLDLGELRLTYIAADGTVLYDNTTNVSTMANHADRPEVADALRDGAGEAERESDTVGKVSIYRAVRLNDGDVLRLSVDRDSAAVTISRDLMFAVFVVAAVIVVCWVFSHLIAARLIRPLLRIDPSNPDASASYVEVTPLVERISEQQAALADQVEELRGADLMRREFTSNVTHELKTPLASISGAAELIRDGIAKPDDVPEFAGRIYDEAAHMTSLVNDILTLSKLDESERAGDRAFVGAEQPVDLHRILADAVDRLKTQADAAHVKLTCGGSSALINGVPTLIDELAYNLCDNAIRYNRKHGRVDAWAGIEDGQPVLRVADTGVGIPKASQGKVFERFYRVDSSRARETGGTGLGLAIVKHAAAYHGAEVSLESVEGEGTTITVRFPASALVDRDTLAN